MFLQRNNRLVWQETVQILEELFEQVWGDRDCTVDQCSEITMSVSTRAIYPVTIYLQPLDCALRTQCRWFAFNISWGKSADCEGFKALAENFLGLTMELFRKDTR